MEINRPFEDWEIPDPDEDDDEGVLETLPCPSCDAPIYEDAEQCPACGEYVTFSTAPLADWPGWLVALGLVGVLAVILTLIVAL